MNSFNEVLHSFKDRVLHVFGFQKQSGLRLSNNKPADSSKSDLNDEGQQCGQSEGNSSDDEYFIAEEIYTTSSNVTLQESAVNSVVPYVNQYKPDIQASKTPTDYGKAYDGENKTVSCNSSKSVSDSNTKDGKETPKRIKCKADPEAINTTPVAEIPRTEPNGANIQRSPTQHRTENSIFHTKIAVVSKPTIHSTETDHEKQKRSPQYTPRVRSTTRESPSPQSCTKSKECKGKAIGDGDR